MRSTALWVVLATAMTLIYGCVATLDNYHDAQQRYLAEHKQWEQFINSCRPLEYDKLGRAIVVQCRVNNDKE
jgi:drug/metabolite transporter superfamily protein YnfA